MVILVTDAFQRSDRQTRIITVLMSLASGTAVLLLAISGRLENLSLMKEFISRQDRFTGELVSHITLAGTAVVFALMIGVPLGILAQRKRKLRGPAFFALNTLQTIPSLALFGILIPTLAALTTRFPVLKEAGIQGIGTAPALIALTVYSLLPVARNTYTGFTAVDPSIVEAGRGMGMTSWQILLKVELPIAFPIIFNGIRVALVQAIGLTAVAALIGAGGLGVFIFQGLGQAATDLILLGAIPTIVIAVLADTAMNGLIAMVKPKGLT
jgi:osmoprotectant transport system permease protein